MPESIKNVEESVKKIEVKEFFPDFDTNNIWKKIPILDEQKENEQNENEQNKNITFDLEEAWATVELK